MTAIAAVFGLLGSIAFPFLRKHLGKLITGHLGFGLETACLVLCVVSIFTPGSPFSPQDFFSSSQQYNSTNLHLRNTSSVASHLTHESLSISELFKTRISVLILMGGIITARFGKNTAVVQAY